MIKVTCPNCSKNFLPDANSILLDVDMEVLTKNYMFCSKYCFDKKVEQVKTNPASDGIIQIYFYGMERLSLVPERWKMYLKEKKLDINLLYK